MCCTLMNEPASAACCCSGPQSSSTVPSSGTMDGEEAGEVPGKRGEAVGSRLGEAEVEETASRLAWAGCVRGEAVAEASVEAEVE